FITKWGVRGSSDGQFDSPRGIAIDSSDNIYVADFGNHRIQKFNSLSGFITKLGIEDGGDGQLQKFNSTGSFITKRGSRDNNDGQFNWLMGIVVDSSDNVYVADSLYYEMG
ncbi:MAG: hypothetical protein HQL05_14895, partial [Nitrospirae bacterium]|nr:hypothetical protein [Nitrospirota bacterium]